MGLHLETIQRLVTFNLRDQKKYCNIIELYHLP